MSTPTRAAGSTSAFGGATPTSYTFQQEIKCMMYSFGDCRTPSSDSAALIGEVTHRQMKDLITRAAAVTNMRGGRFMSVEDILFLLRKNRIKLKRLIKHLSFKEMAKRTTSQSRSEEQEDEGTPDYDVFRQPLTTGHRRRKVSFEFLSSLEQAGDLCNFDLEEVDQIQQERLERQDAITRNMTSAQYAEYTECRQATFQKNASKFKEWLGIGSIVDLKPNQEVTEVIGYLAYETVREIVELALLVKRDMEHTTLDQSSNTNLLPPTPLSPGPSHFGTTPTFITTPRSPTSPRGSMSPPVSPTLGGMATSPLRAQVGSPGTSVGGRTARGRKRKQKGSDFLPESMEIHVTGIQPTHVREALRRYDMVLGPLIPLATHQSKPGFTQKTHCL